MTQVLIDRELLDLCYQAVHAMAGMKIEGFTEQRCAELRAILAHPTQQGEAVEVAPDGYVVVPVEPTPEMAAQTAYDGKQYSDPFDFDDFRKDYAAMLAAAPAPKGRKMNKCTECGSYAINHHCHGRDGSDPELCDVCYWRVRATDYAALEAENARLVERAGYLVEFAQQMARQQGEPYYRILAKAALKKWSGL